MEKLKAFIVKALLRLVGLLPRRLPIGVEEFNNFCGGICETYGIDKPKDYHHAIATMIMHHNNASCYKSPHAIASAIRKAQANETAWFVLQELKKEQEKKKQAEAAPLEASKDAEKESNEPVPNGKIPSARKKVVQSPQEVRV